MIAVIAAVLLSAVVLLRLTDNSLPTYQDVLDGGEDRDDDGFPDFFPLFRGPSSVIIEDSILSLHYADFGFANIVAGFPYKDGKWQFYDVSGEAPALADDDLGEYGIGDTIRLVGSIQVFTYQNSTYEQTVWRLPTGTEELPPPVVSLRNGTSPGADHAVEVMGTSRQVASLHYSFVLLFEGQGIDVVHLDAGPRGIYMEFNDVGRPGLLDSGDSVLFRGLSVGNYTFIVEYARTEISRLAFVRT